MSIDWCLYIVGKIKLLVVVNRFERGGVAKVTEDLIRNIDYSVFDIELHTQHGMSPENLPISLVKTYGETFSGKSKILLLILKKLGVLRRKRKSNLIKAIKRNDIILASGSFSDVMRRAKELNKKAAIWLHGILAVGSHPSESKVASLKVADAVFCVSEETESWIKSRWPEIKSSYLYNPLDVSLIVRKSREKFFNPGEPYIISVGRLVEEKDHKTLFLAYKIAKNRVNNIPRLIVVGDGPDYFGLKELSKKLGLEGDIDFLGHIENPYPWISMAECLVLSSVSEGLPTVLLEALALKTPVISTDCDYGPREILGNGEYGLLAPVRSAEMLAEKLVSMLENDDLKESFMQKGFFRAMEFDVKITMKKWEDALMCLSGGNNR